MHAAIQPSRCQAALEDRAGGFLRRASLVLALASALLVTGLGGSASAAVAGLRVVWAESASNSSNKSVTVSCPAGKRVVGAGGAVGLPLTAGQVALDDIRPDAALTSVTVEGLEDETGYADNWTVTAYAVCATPLAGLERIAATSALSSSNKSVTATCPADKRVVGAGGDVNTFNGQVLLDDLRPNAALTSVTVQGLEDETGNPANWSLTAYAICANPVAGLERVAVTSDLNSVNKTVAASCPGGKNLLGVGGDVNTFNGQVVLAEVRSQASLTSVVVRGEEDQTGNAAGWSVTAYGICASP